MKKECSKTGRKWKWNQAKKEKREKRTKMWNIESENIVKWRRKEKREWNVETKKQELEKGNEKDKILRKWESMKVKKRGR